MSEDIRVYMLLTREERGKLKSLGGSVWLKAVLSTVKMPATRSAFAVPPEERKEIAESVGPAKVIARKHGVDVAFVNYMRRLAKGPHSEARRKKESQCQPPSSS